jgi:hypothetical protein
LRIKKKFSTNWTRKLQTRTLAPRKTSAESNS